MRRHTRSAGRLCGVPPEPAGLSATSSRPRYRCNPDKSGSGLQPGRKIFDASLRRLTAREHSPFFPSCRDTARLGPVGSSQNDGIKPAFLCEPIGRHFHPLLDARFAVGRIVVHAPHVKRRAFAGTFSECTAVKILPVAFGTTVSQSSSVPVHAAIRRAY